LGRRAFGLSGGETQRIALGRALANHPPVLLMDEPLSSLDEETRDRMIELLKGLPQKVGVTVLHVTHSRHEADQLGDLILRLNDGRIETIKGPAASDQIRLPNARIAR
jgi:ABC-type sugar transport system ATPase subunit